MTTSDAADWEECMGAHDETFAEGEWEYRVNEDGTATIVRWLSGIYDHAGLVVVVPDQLGGHPVGGILADPIGVDEALCWLEDGAWLPPTRIASSPHSPARTWCARHCSEHLTWEPTCTDDAFTCTYTVLNDGTARIDTWWSNEAELDVPATIDGWRVSQIGDGAFAFCAFERMDVSEGVAAIGDDAFRSCASLRAATLPRGVARLGRSAFEGCASLASVTLPEGLESIEPFTFAKCTSLTHVVVPEGVRSIANWAFADCGVTRVSLPESLEDILGLAFSGCSRELRFLAPKNSYARKWCLERGRLADDE